MATSTIRQIRLLDFTATSVSFACHILLTLVLKKSAHGQ